ncbi:hypothetical protein MXM64_04185 [Kurthia gibsonii]|uniref:hypothetical protein n=1 Tax=Kurthia TaxID=1649 RepID=UPI002DB990CC|nr:hypothetical protein [Kurthia gibsonii]MEB6112250.1 hypothetical protein [Kurthia gibsonii]
MSHDRDEAKKTVQVIDNSYSYVWSVFKKSNYKFKKTWNNLNKKKLTTLVITGALIGMLGETFGKYLAKARVGVINRLFVKYQWEFKAELARQYSKNGKISIWSALYDSAKSVLNDEKKL